MSVQQSDTTAFRTPSLRSLYGQLYAMQNKHDDALKAFAEDLYYFSLEYGPSDVRTTLGYYNLGKVFQTQVGAQRCACCRTIVQCCVFVSWDGPSDVRTTLG